MLSKYREKPLVYVINEDLKKREKVLQGEVAERITKARNARGRPNFKNIWDAISKEAAAQSLEEHGICQGMTDARLFGDGAASQQQVGEAKQKNMRLLVEKTNKYL